MKWEVQLAGDAFDLTELSKSFTSPDLLIEKRGDQFFLSWTELDHLDTHEAVSSKTRVLLKLLSGCARLALGGRQPITIAFTTKYRPDGKRETLATVEDTVAFRDSVDSSLLTTDGMVVVQRPADEAPKWLALALQDEQVAKAFRLLAGGIDTWVDLYRLYEVIEDDVRGAGEISARNWATGNSIRRFKRTANSPGAVGDEARHGAQDADPPSKPMGLSEAKALVLFVLNEWLREKLP